MTSAQPSDPEPDRSGGDAAGGPAGGLPASGVAAYRSLLSNDRFRNLFWAMLTSSMGDWIGVVAILQLTEQILGGTRAAALGISVVMIARILPTLLLGPVAGVFVDRWDRKRTMIFTDVGRGVVMAVLAFAGDVFALILATLVIEVMSTLFIPAKDSTLPNLVERDRLVQANQLSLGATYATFPLGGTLVALMLAFATAFLTGIEFIQQRPLALPIWVNAATFFASAVFISRITGLERGRRTRQPAGGGSSAWKELTDGFRFIANQPLVRSLVVGVMAAFLAAGGVVAVGPLYANVLNAPETGFAVLIAAVGFGLFAGLAATPALSRRLAKERLFAPGIGVAGVALTAAAFLPRLDLVLVPAFVMGGGAGVSFLAGYTLLQERAGDEIRGRTFAAFNTGVRLALFASLVFAPALVGALGTQGGGAYAIGGVRITLALAGMIALVGAVWTGRSIYVVLSERAELDLGEVGPGRTPGLFVAFEGGEGAGKTTQIERLRRHLAGSGHEVVVTREPGGTELGERIRGMLLDPSSDGLGDRTEALLYAAARAQHVDEVIRPALQRGAVVLADRYLDSSVAYQGSGRGLGEHQIAELNRWGTRQLLPDLVVLLDIDAEEGLRRARQDGPGSPGAPDRLEDAGRDFHRAVNEAFRSRAAADPERWVVLDADRPADELAEDIRDRVAARLPGRGRHTDGVGRAAPDGGTAEGRTADGPTPPTRPLPAEEGRAGPPDGTGRREAG